MKHLSLNQQLSYNLSLLSDEEEKNIRSQIDQNTFDKDISSMIDRGIKKPSAAIPDKEKFFEDLWNKYQKQPPAYKKRTLRKPYTPKMHKILRAASVLLLMGIGSFLFFRQPVQPGILISMSSGKATISHKTKTIPFNKQTRFHTGMQLNTKEKAIVRGILPDKGSINFEGPGQFALVQYNIKNNKPQLRFTLAKGRMNLDLNRQSYNAFIVKTPHALVTVQGTIFSIQVTKKRTRVQVKTGKVKVALVEKTKKFKILSPGQEAIIENSQFQDKKINDSKIKKQPTKGTTTKIVKPVGPRFRDRIYLKSGMVVTGKIISQNDSFLIVRTSSGTLTIAKSSIKTVKVIKN